MTSPDSHRPALGSASREEFIGRGWLVEKVQEALRRPDARWVVVAGEPGVGKSAFARHYAGTGAVQAAHFCKAATGGSLVPMGFVRSLSEQLAENLPEFSRFVLEGERLKKIVANVDQEIGEVRDQGRVYGIYIEKFILETRDPADAFDYLVRKPLRRLDDSLGLKEPVVLLVDGLDEAARYEHEPTITDLIIKAGDLPDKARWLLTSRPETFLGAFPAVLVRIEDQSRDNLDDIEAFIGHELSKEELQVPGNSPELAKTLKSRSKGNFLYLEYVFRQLHSQAVREERLSPPEELPDGLDGVYREFLGRMVRDPLDVHWRSLYRPVLGALSVAREPLGFDRMVAFSGAEPQDVQDALTGLGQIVEETGSSEGPCYAVYHTSFSDFLTDRTRNPSYWIDPARAHREIARRYLDPAPQDWRDCDRYGLRHLAAHLSAGRQTEELAALLLDFGWMRAKLEALGITDLVRDYSFLEGHPAARLVWEALWLSAYTLLESPDELASQLTGRLLGFDAPEIRGLLKEIAEKTKGPWLRPLAASLQTPGGPLLFTLVGHTGSILDVDLTPDGRRAVSASRDGTLMVWDLDQGSRQAVLQGHENAVYAVRLTPDGSTVFSGGDDTRIIAWDLAGERLLYMLEDHAGSVRSLDITPDGRRLLSLSGEGELFLWDLERKTLKDRLSVEGGYYPSVAVSPDGRRVLASSGPNAVLVDLDTFEIQKTLYGEGDAVWGITWLPDNRRALLSSDYWPVVLWDVETGERLSKLEGHTAGVKSLAVTADGKLALSASDDHSFILWDLTQEKSLLRHFGHSDDVKAVRLTPDHRRVVTVSSDTSLKVWDFELLRSRRPEEQASARQYPWLAPDGRRALRKSADGGLELRGLESLEQRILGPAIEDIRHAAFTPDGKRALVVDDLGNLSAWDLEQGASLAPLPAHPGASRTAVTADGRLGLSVATAARDGAVRIWDLESGAATGGLPAGADWIGDLAVNRAGSRAVLIEYDAFQVWDLETQRRLIRQTKQIWKTDFWEHTRSRALIPRSWGPWAAAVTPDARRVVYVQEDGSLRVFDVPALRDIFERGLSDSQAGESASDPSDPVSGPSAPHHSALSVAISARGNRIAAAWDGFVQVFDVDSTEAAAGFRVIHRRPISGIALSPGGRYVATVAGETGAGKYGGRSDTSLKVWDIGPAGEKPSRPAAVFTADSGLLSCSFYGNGYILKTGGAWLRLENFDPE